MNLQNICITEKEYYKGREIFEKAEGFRFIHVGIDEAVIAAAIKKYSATAAVIGVEPYIGPLYTALPAGGVIARFGVGCDGINKQKAAANKIIIVNTPQALDYSVAEHAIWLMGALVRKAAQLDAATRANKWLPEIGHELAGKTLLVVGCGKIGCRVARIASFGFLMRVLGVDTVQLDRQRLNKQFGIELQSDLENAISQADFISLHIPSVAATRHLVNAGFLAKMKPSAYIINTARGLIVDEIALFDALASNRIAGAALDVFETEPYKPLQSNKDLRNLSNVVLTPHIGSSTYEACQRMAEQIVFNLKCAVLKKYDQMDIVNRDVLEQIEAAKALTETPKYQVLPVSHASVNNCSVKFPKQT